jgi:peptidoglycan hydrolase-like protein with peptidoglycan-binding domain
MDDVKSYLGNKKNLNWKSLTEKNSGAFITAIQIALERMGYEVGKIDGVFADKGKTTSKTKTAVEKFQKDNGLPPDGIPGPKTITKILEKLPKQPLRTPPNWRTPPQRKPNFPKITP